MSGKSKEEVAFEILSKLKGVGIWGENNQEAILDMYSKCLEATAGLREVDGKTPLALRTAAQAPAPAVQAAAAPIIPPQVARATHPAQSQVPPRAQQPATPAQQQQRVQQAYQQQNQPR